MMILNFRKKKAFKPLRQAKISHFLGAKVAALIIKAMPLFIG